MGSYLLSGTMMRLALQQGYHRDPSHFPNIAAFQGEMRRRIWSAVSQHDLLFSVLIGLPKCIRYAECDTQSPGNFHEEELYEDMRELPPSRPVSEDTEISYQVVKLQMMRAYGHVLEFINLLEPQPYEEVLKLDLKLMEAKAYIPPHLQLRTVEEMANDPPSRVMERYILQLFYNKAQCLLHRKHWDSVPCQTSRETWYYSRRSCMNSALALLSHQASMHRAAQPGGLLEKIKWYHFPITNHDFLLAAMILCLDIMSNFRRAPQPDDPVCFVTEAEKLQAIQKSRAIWAEVIDDCRDARRAVSVLTSVLNKISASKEEQKKTASAVETKEILSASATNPNVDSLRYSPYFTDQFGLGIPLIADQPAGVDVNMETDFLDTLGSDLTVPGDFNWVRVCTHAMVMESNHCQGHLGSSNGWKSPITRSRECCRIPSARRQHAGHRKDAMAATILRLYTSQLYHFTDTIMKSALETKNFQDGSESSPPRVDSHLRESKCNLLLARSFECSNCAVHVLVERHRRVGLTWTTLQFDNLLPKSFIQPCVDVRWSKLDHIDV